MRCQNPGDLGALLREARRRQGISQRQLAIRAGTSQDAISRIERGAESPTLARFATLMAAMGMRPVVETRPIDTRLDEDPRAGGDMSPGERLREAASWNLVAAQLAEAGERARNAGHPATRRSR